MNPIIFAMMNRWWMAFASVPATPAAPTKPVAVDEPET